MTAPFLVFADTSGAGRGSTVGISIVLIDTDSVYYSGGTGTGIVVNYLGVSL